MKVVSFAGADDVGGVGYRTATAFTRLQPDWIYRSWVWHPSYLQFPVHDVWDSTSLGEWNDADVRHGHDYIPEHAGQTCRPTVITFHGTGFREDPDGLLRYAAGKGAKRVLVSTLDLWLQRPHDVEWMPQIEDIADLEACRLRALKALPPAESGRLRRICHAPTNRALKSTEAFLQACEGLPVEVVLIERKSWREALGIKATCDILFDQTAYGYGGNSTEAWAMGIPTICGAPDNVLAEYERRFGYVPFLTTTGDVPAIRRAIERMLDFDEHRRFAQLGREHARRYHSQEAGVARLTPVYEELAS